MTGANASPIHKNNRRDLRKQRNMTQTVGSAGNWSTTEVNFEQALPPHLGYRGDQLFDVFLDGLDRLLLVPKSSLGAAILSRLLSMSPRCVGNYRGLPTLTDETLDSLTLEFESRPSLRPSAAAGKSLNRERLLSDEQYGKLLAVLDEKPALKPARRKSR